MKKIKQTYNRIGRFFYTMGVSYSKDKEETDFRSADMQQAIHRAEQKHYNKTHVGKSGAGKA